MESIAKPEWPERMNKVRSEEEIRADLRKQLNEIYTRQMEKWVWNNPLSRDVCP